jgi:hypothetical protein
MKFLDLVYFLGAVLIIPAIPALLIYLLLPSDSKVGGPFRGLNIRLTGAFSGYFLLVLIASSITVYYFREQKAIIGQQPKLQEWWVQTVLKIDDLEQPPMKTDFRVILVPTEFDITPAGKNQVILYAKVPVGIDTREEEKSPYLPFRALQIEYSAGIYAPVSLFLGQEQAQIFGQNIRYNKDSKLINVDSIEIPRLD